MFLRFVIREDHPELRRPAGLFRALRRLRDGGALMPYELTHAVQQMDWLERNLPRPGSGSAAAKTAGVHWFKEGAAAHIDRMRELAALLVSHGVVVELMTTDRPGRVTYEDANQIVAEPATESPG